MWRTSFAVVEAMIDPVVVLRPLCVGEEVVDFVFVAANDAAERLLTPTEDGTVVGRLLVEVMPSAVELGLLVPAAEVITTGTPQRLAVAIPTKLEDHPRYWEFTGVTYGSFLLVTALDVTDRVERDRARADIDTYKQIAAERERVARDLHDSVIQQVIGASMLLARISNWASKPMASELEHVISIHDDIVRELRSILFGLQRPVRDLGAEVAGIVGWAAEALGFTPELNIGALGPAESNQLEAAHLLLTLREVLSNIARHARAEAVWIEIVATADRLTMTVDDDGCGISDAERHSGRGLDNLVARARLLDGWCDITPRPEGGTRVRWSVPIVTGERTVEKHPQDARQGPFG